MTKKVICGDESLLDVFEEDYGTPNYTEEFKQQVLDSVSVPSLGRVQKATFVGENENEFLLDGQFKDLIRVSKNKEERQFLEKYEKGEELDVIITHISNSLDFTINGSVAIIYKEIANQELKSMEKDDHVEAIINELTPAGYNCTIILNKCEINAFLPQILAGVNKIREEVRSELVGQKLEVCIEGYAGDKGTWIISRRKYLNKLIPKFIEELQKDVVYSGTVTGSTTFGVFVEFNECLTGMIHKTNLNPDFSGKINDIEPGTPIDFYVKEIVKGNKLILTQILTDSIWDSINIGQTLNGKIKDHKKFGTLVELDHETLGLIHTSEITDSVTSLKSGDEIKIKVLAVDRSNRKIYLKKA